MIPIKVGEVSKFIREKQAQGFFSHSPFLPHLVLGMKNQSLVQGRKKLGIYSAKE